MTGPSNFKFENNSFSFLYRFIDVLILGMALAIMLMLYGVEFDRSYLLLLAVELFLFTYLAESAQLYKSWRIGRFSRMIWSLSGILLLSFFLIVAALFILKEGETYSRVVILGWFLCAWFILVAWRVTAKAIKTYRRKHGLSMQKVAIIGLTHSSMELHRQIEKNIELGFDCVGFFDDRDAERLKEFDPQLIAGSIEDAVALARRGEVAKLYLCLPIWAEKRIATIIQALGDTTVDVLLIPDFMLKNLMHARIGSVGEIDTISVFESPLNGMKDFYKRSFDILFSVCVLLAIAPLLVIIALGIKLTSRGPVLFHQDRYGLDGKRIGVYKFRSMTVAENGDKVTQATRGDRRITPFGAFLRRTSLDELPQFFNVLMGDMSVVGPRPHAVAHNEEYRQLVNYYMLRHKVRPGITGWAQVNGWRGETDTLEKMEKRIEYDLAYIRNWSLWLDIKIVYMTFFTGFTNKNAY
ncbi:undecaprenyl-phosphate glucose phosphotransferase [Shewanella sp. AS16]|uniref:undecaprenyl-phosphate glucose phosphotransferase n=1 Tax=Shewanella sp. AS16 TaxID=2907625 RepID=UPI001F2DA13E|nr:undecaprenyl-phosphate glucose phosphotransferase [Shewanella sp. AS16]MCE9686973.1 undecaprenyl-phosphate glucose phosphotransferase [Shewanella sp. AS16]